MTTRWRDVVLAVLPTWLRGPFGQNLMAGTLGLWADLAADSGIFAITSAWLKHPDHPDDALGTIGAERRMPQYPSEVAANYRERLHGAWDAYGQGKERSTIEQLVAFGFAPTLATVPALSGWTLDGLTRLLATGPDDTGNCVTLTEDSSSGEHAITYAVTSLPTDKMVEVRFRVRVDGDREWVRVAIGSDYVYLNVQTRAVGADVAPGGHGTVRGYEGAWATVRARFWSTSSSAIVRVGFATADGTYSYVGDGSSALTVADLTVGTPEPIVLRDNEAAAPDRFDTDGGRWWSQFWVIVCEGTHSYTASIPAADQVGIEALVKKWKPGIWSCQRVVFITGGTVAALQSGLTTNEWAALLNPEDNTTLEVTI